MSDKVPREENDNTGRLCRFLYGEDSERTVSNLLGGANAPMLDHAHSILQGLRDRAHFAEKLGTTINPQEIKDLLRTFRLDKIDTNTILKR